jgi:localization factor PodJL
MAEMDSWVLEGVEPEAQQAAKLAARRAGLSLGAWMTQTLMAAAAAELKRGPGAAPAVGANAGGHQPPALTTEVLIDNIRRLAQRVESAEQRTNDVIAPLSEKMGNLSERIEEISARANLSTAPMERALARMAERIEQLEGRGRPSRLSEEPATPKRRFRFL